MPNQNNDINEKTTNPNIHKILYKILTDFESDTGIAITHITMDWHDLVGGSHYPGNLKIKSKMH